MTELLSDGLGLTDNDDEVMEMFGMEEEASSVEEVPPAPAKKPRKPRAKKVMPAPPEEESLEDETSSEVNMGEFCPASEEVWKQQKLREEACMRKKYEVLSSVRTELGNMCPDMAADAGYNFLSFPKLRALLDSILERHGVFLECQGNCDTIGYALWDSKQDLFLKDINFSLPTNYSDVQQLGCAITYLRKYALLCMFDLVVEDRDGKAHQRISERAPAERKPETTVQSTLKPSATPDVQSPDPARVPQEMDSPKEQVLYFFQKLIDTGKVDKIENPQMRRALYAMLEGKITKFPSDEKMLQIRDILILTLNS
jgi:hypothetical protein